MFHWLVMSDVSKGLYCKFCFLFAPATKSNVTLKTLVKTPLLKFSKLTGKDGCLTVHSLNKYHLDSVLSGNAFLKSYQDPSFTIINQVNLQRLNQINENRERIRPIIETLILCGRQNIALRGAVDDGPLLNDTSNSLVANPGNFRELLKFKINSGDQNLKNHLDTTSSRATYISKTTQNELLNCIGEEIQLQIIKDVNKAKFYAVIFDETTDIAHREQLSLSIRYILNNKINEKFLTFVDAYQSILEEDIMLSGETKLTGQALGNIVLNILKQFNLNVENCVGIGTDGCAVMTSKSIGAVTTILKECIYAVRCPCFNHALNNSLAQSSKVVSIRNTVGCLKEIVAFFNGSAKRTTILKNKLGKSLSGLCQTRWIEQHDGILQFKSTLPKVIMIN